jgi:YebC/PmpR family DNA-binding regulatory protein
MSGHSKWATIKHKKGAADAKRAKIFAKLIKQVEVAAREGGGDLESNASLRTMYQKARDSSVPLDTIERAVKRGTGELEGVSYEPIMYEGYAPAGVALYIDVLTDNRNRSGSEVRSMLSKNGGSLAEPGAVSWQFDRKGVVLLPKGGHDEDDLMMIALEAGAEDLEDVGEAWQLTSEPTDLNGLRDALVEANIEFTSADLVMVPQQTVELNESDAKSVLRLIEVLEDNDDVQDVFANFDISDEVMEALTAD